MLQKYSQFDQRLQLISKPLEIDRISATTAESSTEFYDSPLLSKICWLDGDKTRKAFFTIREMFQFCEATTEHNFDIFETL